jgi:hypothetical protein
LLNYYKIIMFFFNINFFFFRYQIQNLPNPFKLSPNDIVDEINTALSLKTFNLNYLIIKLLLFWYLAINYIITDFLK